VEIMAKDALDGRNIELEIFFGCGFGRVRIYKEPLTPIVNNESL